MFMKKYQVWLQKVTDSALLSELKAIANDPKEIENRFFKDLEFGTGGLRGILGAGSNYMNIYTVGRATQGIADYMNARGLKSTAISYDSRNFSREFAELVASVFAGNGIKSVITKELMPTPFASFAILHHKSDMGVMITASHNPAKYNGYKAYAADGCQINKETADAILAAVDKVDPFEVKTLSFAEGLASGMIAYVEDSVVEQYLSNVWAQKQTDGKLGSDLKVVYTPLNGAGCKLCPEIMSRLGVKPILVKEQAYPDGNFPTCPFPNPEIEQALDLGIKLLKEQNADLLIATDPDADRIGLTVLKDGKPVLLTGNQTGVLLLDYIAANKAAKNLMPKNPIMVKTIVTTTLANRVAEKYGIEVIDVLTGFKYIGEQINILQSKGEENRFVFGYEESYGYLTGAYVRDKDAVVSAMLACEMAAYYKSQGKTLADRLDEIHAEFGYYKHKQLNYEFLGAAGLYDMLKLMDTLRAAPFTEIAGLKVTEFIDYMNQTKVNLPKENVLIFNLEKGAQVVVRPSGTEPKLKLYLTTVGSLEEADALSLKITEFANPYFKK